MNHVGQNGIQTDSEWSWLSGHMLIFQINNVFGVLHEPFILGYHFLEAFYPPSHRQNIGGVVRADSTVSQIIYTVVSQKYHDFLHLFSHLSPPGLFYLSSRQKLAKNPYFKHQLILSKMTTGRQRDEAVTGSHKFLWFYLGRDKHCQRYNSGMKYGNTVDCHPCSHTVNVPIPFVY